MNTFDDYTEERECEYKNERYSVRDNGAILRHPKDGKNVRRKDNVWTFGDTPHNGYIYYCGIPVHRVVATAFIGEAPTVQHVVDHIDTNRQNNRPENLRWLTKLENILNNEITRRKVIYICGSIENFLQNPTLLYNHEKEDPNFTWMRRVSKEEANNALVNMKSWLKEGPKTTNGRGFGEWIFDTPTDTHIEHIINLDSLKQEIGSVEEKTCDSGELTWDIIEKSLGGSRSDGTIAQTRASFEENAGKENSIIVPKIEIKEYKDSLTANATQHITWKTPAEFPLCPSSTRENALEEYSAKMKIGEIVAKTRWNQSRVQGVGKNDLGSLIVKCKMEENDGTHSIKPWSIITIHVEDGKFAHQSYSTFFNEDGADKYFTILQGKEWTGGDVFDDYC